MTASLAVSLIHAPLLAAATKAATTSQNQSSSSFLVLVLPLLVIGYFLLVRPQRQRARQQQQQRQQIGVGDQVVTAGGLLGRVTKLTDERATLEVAPGVSMEFVRQAISRRLLDGEVGVGLVAPDKTGPSPAPPGAALPPQAENGRVGGPEAETGDGLGQPGVGGTPGPGGKDTRGEPLGGASEAPTRPEEGHTP